MVTDHKKFLSIYFVDVKDACSYHIINKCLPSMIVFPMTPQKLRFFSKCHLFRRDSVGEHLEHMESPPSYEAAIKQLNAFGGRIGVFR